MLKKKKKIKYPDKPDGSKKPKLWPGNHPDIGSLPENYLFDHSRSLAANLY